MKYMLILQLHCAILADLRGLYKSIQWTEPNAQICADKNIL